MKKTFFLLAIVTLIVSLCACSQQDLEEMTSGMGDGYATIVWGDKTYVPYGTLADYGEHGNQIGIVDGDKGNRVYELKGYSTDGWIVNSFPYDAAMLYREIDVSDIPDGWQSEYEWNQFDSVGPGKPITAYISDDVIEVKITHVLMGQLAEWTIEGDDIAPLQTWANGL